jgi:XTP/dITP diphosphohydrolase
MKKLIYLTTNPHKVEEANEFFGKKYGFNLEIVNPDFEILETQAKTCSEVVAFSAKYAADKLGCAVLKSDSGLYLDALGGLPGPYNAYFDKQIGVDKFLELLKNETNRKARLEHCFAYCEPGEEPIVFTGGGTGTVALEPKGERGRWHDKFYIPDGETMTLSELREIDYEKEATFWGDAKDQFAKWYIEKYKDELN